MATGPHNPSSERSSAPRRVRDGCQCAASLLAAAAQALDDAGDRVAEIEHHWSTLAGRTRFDQAGRILQDLLDQLEQAQPENSRP